MPGETCATSRYSRQHWGEDRANAYDDAINDALVTLGMNPEIGKLRDDLRPGLRSFPVEQHLVLYRILDEAIAVQRIIHARQHAKRAIRTQPD